MKNNSLAVFGTVVALTLGAGVQNAAAEYRHGDAYTDFARVTDVSPIFETVVKSVPVEQCWSERVPVRHADYGHRRHHKSHHSATPTLIGAIIGGAIGNELGSKKRNKQIGVAVGGLLGASIGRDIGRERAQERRGDYESTHGDYDREYQLVERCDVNHETYEEKEVVGYNVSYRYKGRAYETVTDTDPGDKLKVRVAVTPLTY